MKNKKITQCEWGTPFNETIYSKYDNYKIKKAAEFLLE